MPMTEQQKQARRDKIKATIAARTPEEVEAIAARRRQTMQAKTPEQLQQMRDNMRRAISARSPEEVAAINAKRAATMATLAPEARLAIVQKTVATKSSRPASVVADERAKRAATKAAITPEQRAEHLRKQLASRENWTPERHAQYVEKLRKTRSRPDGVSFKQASVKARATMLDLYGTVCHWKIGKARGTCAEDQVRAFFDSLGFNFEESVLPGTPQALDGLDREHAIAFEYHGLFWHCEDSREPRLKDYHVNKLKACSAIGVRLFSIFEDEWKLRQTQVKGFLRAALGKNSTKLQGRKLKVVEITDKTAQAFYNDYHIQGATLTGMRSAGLYHGEDLVGCMTLGKHHRGGDQVVLTRLCFKSDVSVIGGSAKLFKFLVTAHGCREVISWSDNRWSEGGVYRALGFAMDEELGPDYAYVNLAKPVARISKQSQQKALTKCPPDKTELEWAKERGLSRIWDCGKTRWKWTA